MEAREHSVYYYCYVSQLRATGSSNMQIYVFFRSPRNAASRKLCDLSLIYYADKPQLYNNIYIKQPTKLRTIDCKHLGIHKNKVRSISKR